MSNWLAMARNLEDDRDAHNMAQKLIDSLHENGYKLSQILRPRKLKAKYDNTVDPGQNQTTALLEKVEGLLEVCKNELGGGEYCNIMANLIEAQNLIRPTSHDELPQLDTTNLEGKSQSEG
jgi:hypothetical protein